MEFGYQISIAANSWRSSEWLLKDGSKYNAPTAEISS